MSVTDVVYGLVTKRWQMWSCADCDPEHYDGDETPEFDEPHEIILRVGQRPPNSCVRCGSYLSYCEGAGPLRATSEGAA